MANDFKKKFYAELKKNRPAWILAIIVFFFFWLLLYENSGIFTGKKGLEYTAAGQYYSDVPIHQLSGDMALSQTFISQKNTFSRIQIPFHFSSKPHGSVGLELSEAETGKVVFNKSIHLNGLQDGEFINIDFPKITNASGKKYELTINGNGQNSRTYASVWKSSQDHYKQGELTINGKTVKGDLRFAILDVEYTTLVSKKVYALAGGLILFLFLLSVLALRKYKYEMHKAFLVTALPIGLLLAIIIPPFDQLDEYDHFLRSFEVSEGMFVNQVTSNGLGNYIPVSLPDTVHKVQFINGNGYQYGIAHEAFNIQLNPNKRDFIRNYASSYPPTIYIPQALGMMAGRFLFHSPMMMMYLGRMFNLLAYLSIVYFALKIVPIKKKLFYTLALLPMAIIQASSLSGDSMIISSAFLFVSYILYLAYGKVEQIKLKHVLTAIGIGIFIAVSKIVYLPMVFLFLLIPTRKFTSKMDFIKKLLLILAGILIPYLIWNLLNLANLSIPDVRIHSGVSPKEQINFILTQPLHYGKIFIDSLLSLGESKFLGMLGKKGTIYQYLTPNIIIYTFLFLLIFLGLIDDENEAGVKWRRYDKFIMMFIMLIVAVLIYTALYVGYTAVGHSIIDGVQGRYFLPVAVFLFLSISNNQLINRYKDINFLLYTILHCCLYFLLFSYLLQING